MSTGNFGEDFHCPGQIAVDVLRTGFGESNRPVSQHSLNSI